MMIQNNSKKSLKTKKKSKENEVGNYNLLLKSSMQRDSNKQNCSANINSFKERSFINNSKALKESELRKYNQRNDSNYSKILIKNNPVSFFQDVKFLKDSRIQVEEQDNKYGKARKQYQKNIELSKKSQIKWVNSQKLNNSHKMKEISTEQIQNKLQAYIEFVNDFFDEVIKSNILRDNKIWRKKYLLESLSRELLNQCKKVRQTQLSKPLTESIHVSNFSLNNNSKSLIRQNQISGINEVQNQANKEYKKIINQLSSQNMKLQQLISENERKNIQIFIKMNENESKQIEKCKQYLSKLYSKYKILEQIIQKQTLKNKKIKKQNKALDERNNQLVIQNSQYRAQIQNLKNFIKQNGHPNTSKLSFQDDSAHTIFNFNISQPKQNNRRNNKNIKGKSLLLNDQNFNIQKSFITQRQKASSCLQEHAKLQNLSKNQQIMSCATLAKNKNSKRIKQKVQKIGINLKQQFVESKDQQFKSSIELLKSKLKEQKTQKLKYKKDIEQLSETLKKKNEKVNKMQALINDQIYEIEIMMNKNRKLTKDLENAQLTLSNPTIPKQTNKIVTQLINMHPNLTSSKTDQYHVIALQASILQKFLS